ncbi:MAG: molybdopterin-dependent oxidoreductase [Chloroflexi bacterium]|nr:molybdopterin-dependent oxidoreductase [Chloroflexota bacterium]
MNQSISKTLETEDRWIPSVCYMCNCGCQIRAHVVNGVVVKIEGNLDNPHNDIRLCAKGQAGIMSLYDPFRLKSPLKRTNPEKGIGVDPRWVEISWDEALDTLVERLKKIQAEDPRKLIVAGLDFNHVIAEPLFAGAFGTPNFWKGGADYFCGNAVHPVTFLTNGSFYSDPDFELCNYSIMMGIQTGFMVGHNSVTEALEMADARLRGMKLVVVDPIGTNGASKADEWLPIRPGTDAALVLSWVNVLLNELNIYDATFLKKYTNAPYLIGPEGYYVRDAETQKPLMWDEGKAKPYDASDLNDPALEGSYTVDGVEARPAFELFREHVKGYSPEKVSTITTIPTETIRRIAREFGEAARIGSKIVIHGRELPYRPAAIAWNKGSSHRHGMLMGLAIQSLNTVVGAMDVPGGQIGFNPKGPFWEPKVGPDGLMMPADMLLLVEPAYPARKVTPPQTVDLYQFLPVAPYAAPFIEDTMLDSQKFKLPYQPELFLNFDSNPLMSTSNPEKMAEVLLKIPFLVDFNSHITETDELADMVLPTAHYLERFSPFPNSPGAHLKPGLGVWYWTMSQSVVDSPPGVRSWPEVVLEMVYRMGMGSDFNIMVNTLLYLREPHTLDPNKQYTYEEIGEIWAKSRLGAEYNLQQFKEQGCIVSGPKKVEDVYDRVYIKPKIPLYYEYLKRAGEDVKRVTTELGIPWDTSDYQPIPDWKPCPSYENSQGGYDLYAVNYKLPFHTFSYTTQNPWLNELAEHHPYAYKVLVHSQVAKRKGIKDGDSVYVESIAGKVKGVAKVTECVHPEVVGIAGTFGNWATGRPIAKGKGVHFNTLLPSTPEHIDTVSAALDACPRVKIYKG